MRYTAYVAREAKQKQGFAKIVENLRFRLIPYSNIDHGNGEWWLVAVKPPNEILDLLEHKGNGYLITQACRYSEVPLMAMDLIFTWVAHINETQEPDEILAGIEIELIHVDVSHPAFGS